MMQSFDIYEIYNTVDDDTFVGVSKNFTKRFSKYRNMYRKIGPTSKLFKHFEKHGTQAFRIRLLEEFECETKEETKAKKREHLRRLNPTLNEKLCLDTEEIRINRIPHDIRRNERRRVMYTCECGKTIQVESKLRHDLSQRHMDYIH